MSHAPSDPADSPVAAKSKKPRSDKKMHWDKVKVFDKPEFRLPYRLAMYQGGPGKADCVKAPLWMQVAVESGLVEMVSPDAASRAGGQLSTIDGSPLPRTSREELEFQIRRGLERSLAELERRKLIEQDKKE